MGLEPAAEELFRRDLAGNGFHRLWELAWKEHLSSGGSLEELADRFFDAAYGDGYPGLLSDQRLFRHRADQREKNRRLGALQDAMERSGLGEARSEQRREFPLPELEIGGTVFRGRCDRMDILRDGSALLFDYKSGRSGKYTKASSSPPTASPSGKARNGGVPPRRSFSDWATARRRARSMTARPSGWTREKYLLRNWSPRQRRS